MKIETCRASSWRAASTARTRVLIAAAMILSGCPKTKAPQPVPPRARPHFASAAATATAAAPGIQLSLTLTYDDATPFAGTATITDDSSVYRSVARNSVPVEVAAADFDATGKASASLIPDPSAIYSAHLYDAGGVEVIGPIPILTMFFDLSQISSFTLTGTIRKADNALIQPYSLSAP
jgi:hypothetical protein